MNIKINKLEQETSFNKAKKDNQVDEILINVFDKYMLTYDIEDVVYIKTDEFQKKRVITGISIKQNGVIYVVTHCTDESYHYDFELSRTEDLLMKIL
jgi:hypothetical protein